MIFQSYVQMIGWKNDQGKIDVFTKHSLEHSNEEHHPKNEVLVLWWVLPGNTEYCQQKCVYNIYNLIKTLVEWLYFPVLTNKKYNHFRIKLSDTSIFGMIISLSITSSLWRKEARDVAKKGSFQLKLRLLEEISAVIATTFSKIDPLCAISLERCLLMIDWVNDDDDDLILKGNARTENSPIRNFLMKNIFKIIII